jgi:mutator protein MutT
MIAIPLAGCVITNEAGEVLLIHRNTPELTQWELPGGKLEKDETFVEAAVRELHEELKLRVAVTHELGSAIFELNTQSWHYHWFRAVIQKGEPKIGERKRFDKFAYVNLLTADTNELSANVQNLVQAIKNGTVTL